MLDWLVAGWIGVLGGALVVGLQIWQLTELPFFPGSSGYASCFIGWASINLALVLSAARTGWRPPWHASSACGVPRSEDGGTSRSTLPNARMLRVGLEGCTYFWGFIALVGTFFWVLFYVL